MEGSLILIVTAVVILAILFFVLKNIGKIIINSVLGLAILFIVNYFHLLGYVGKPDITINAVSVIVCALGGIPGALIVILLALLGINI